MDTILIFGDKSPDITIDSVIDWLRHYKASYIRINDLHNDFKFKIFFDTKNTLKLVISDSENQKETVIGSAWYRRWSNSFYSDNIDSHLVDLIRDEKRVNFTYFCLSIAKEKWLNHPNDCDNKLQQLLIAKQVGLSIPNTILTNNRIDLREFSFQHNNFVVTKTHNQVSYQLDNLNYSNFTTDLKDIDIPVHFPPAILQEGIKKQFDLRIFYLFGECFTSAIMPLYDDCELDVRENPKDEFIQRIVPYQLPSEVEDKIKSFMKKIDINSGSIDMLVTDNFDYVFLELNPVGQNRYYSDKCNYYIEEAIAKSLINILNEKEN